VKSSGQKGNNGSVWNKKKGTRKTGKKSKKVESSGRVKSREMGSDEQTFERTTAGTLN